MNDNKQKTANALLSAFPTADSFKAFKEEKISEKTISGLLAAAKENDIISIESEEEFLKFIQCRS